MTITTNDNEYSNAGERSARNDMLSLMQHCPIPDEQMLPNLGLFLNSKNLSRILFMDFIYRKIVDVQGVVLDFGTRWGQNMALFASLRGIYEPFNRHRKVVGFDTFSGFPSVSKQDGSHHMMEVGSVTTTENYDEYLRKLIKCHEDDNPLSHIHKYEVVAGDATKKLPTYLNDNPETIVALAYFDFDIYEPTRDCLKLIADRVVKGSVLAFDELNDHDSPGETTALQEVVGLRNVRLKRYQYTSRVSYFIVE